MSLASILDFLVHVKQVQSSRQVCIKAHGSRQPMRGGYVRKAGQWKRVGLCVAIATSPPHYRHCPREKRDGHQPPPPSIGLMTRSLTSISSSACAGSNHFLPTHFKLTILPSHSSILPRLRLHAQQLRSAVLANIATPLPGAFPVTRSNCFIHIFPVFEALAAVAKYRTSEQYKTCLREEQRQRSNYQASPHRQICSPAHI